MLLNARRWGQANAECVVCIHGVTQHGGVFTTMAERLADLGHPVLAVDLRGHGKSRHEPPWNTERHVQDVLETAASFGVRRATWIGHSFGARVAAALAAEAGVSTEGLVLLDPGLEIPPDLALREAEVDRLDMRKGSDGRYRFSFCPSAVVAAWSEMCLPAPPIAAVRTLVVCTESSLFTVSLEERYRACLASKFGLVRVPHGHNPLWESAEETAGAVERFLEAGQVYSASAFEPLSSYVDASGLLRPLL
jgi:lipase